MRRQLAHAAAVFAAMSDSFFATSPVPRTAGSSGVITAASGEAWLVGASLMGTVLGEVSLAEACATANAFTKAGIFDSVASAVGPDVSPAWAAADVSSLISDVSFAPVSTFV